MSNFTSSAIAFVAIAILSGGALLIILPDSGTVNYAGLVIMALSGCVFGILVDRIKRSRRRRQERE